MHLSLYLITTAILFLFLLVAFCFRRKGFDVQTWEWKISLSKKQPPQNKYCWISESYSLFVQLQTNSYIAPMGSSTGDSCQHLLIFCITIRKAKKATEDHLVGKQGKYKIEKGSVISFLSGIMEPEHRSKDIQIISARITMLWDIFVSDSFV